MKQYNFDDINPGVNPNENLGNRFDNYFRISFFDVSKFEIRLEKVRDKGIDFHIELSE
jgi:hypothetical protein